MTFGSESASKGKISLSVLTYDPGLAKQNLAALTLIAIPLVANFTMVSDDRLGTSLSSTAKEVTVV